VISSFERFSYPKASVDLVNAQYALPFNPPETFGNVLRAINNSLRKGGIFTGQFFGDRDEWNVAGTQMTFHTRDQAIEALSPFKTIDLQEIDRDRSAASGSMKHWHLFEFIVAKR